MNIEIDTAQYIKEVWMDGLLDVWIHELIDLLYFPVAAYYCLDLMGDSPVDLCVTKPSTD